MAIRRVRDEGRKILEERERMKRSLNQSLRSKLIWGCVSAGSSLAALPGPGSWAKAATASARWGDAPRYLLVTEMFDGPMIC
jgi:hypothetical protein